MDKQQLLNLMQESSSTLETLKTIEYEGLKEKITELESVFCEFKESGEDLLAEDDVLQIGIVGQVKAGKSSFLNSLFFEGESVLPKASTPMTAGLTIVEYAPKNTFEVEYFTQKDWEIFVRQDEEYKKREQEVRTQNPDAPESIIKKELEIRTSEKIRSAHEMISACGSKAKQKIGKEKDVQAFSDLNDLQKVLEQYVGANGEYTSVVKSLYIKMNDDRLKGLRIVDTPGVNDPVVSRENRTRMFLQSCHGVFLLSASTDFLGSGDVSFLNSRIGGSSIGAIVLLASKFDSVLQDLGAEREMKREECGDLADTVEMQTKKFKRRLRELSDTIDEKLRGKIKIDTTAGIGYSIANKSPEKWDNTERQVVQQMTRYYPDYFSSEEDIKEYFESLANIDNIREQYLEGVFMGNKDSIIVEKVQDFFISNKKEIYATIERILMEFKNRQEQLNATTIAEIQRQKEMQNTLFENLNHDFFHIFNDFSSRLQTEVKSIANTLRFSDIRTIPTENTTAAITYKGRLWGHNTEEMFIEQVNTYELANQIKHSVETYATSWNVEWKKLLDRIRQETIEKLNAKISNFELEIMSASFKDSYYRSLIDKALDNLRNHRELAIGDVITDYERRGYDVANNGQYYPDGTEELSESQVADHLKRQLREHNSQLILSFRQLGDFLRSDIKTQIENNLSSAVGEIEKLKSSFALNLKKEGEEYLEKLEQDMLEKTIVLQQIESIIKCLTELHILYK